MGGENQRKIKEKKNCMELTIMFLTCLSYPFPLYSMNKKKGSKAMYVYYSIERLFSDVVV